jgi:hypothetical protein
MYDRKPGDSRQRGAGSIFTLPAGEDENRPQENGVITTQGITVYKYGYSGMRPMIFFSIICVSLIMTAGCISQIANPLPMTSPPPPIYGDQQMNYSGSTLAIAFRSDEISTTSPEAKELFTKGLTYSTQYARYNESLGYFDAALAIDQNFTEAWVAKGVALHNMARYDEAIENYNKALTLSPSDAGIWHIKGITLKDSGKPEEAKACNRRAAEIDPRYK